MIASLTEVESAYQEVISSGMLTGAYTLAALIAAIITIVKIVKQYSASLEDDKSFQIRNVINLFKPYWTYLLIIALLPFGISFIESILSELELTIKSKLPTAYGLGDPLYIADNQLAALEKDYENVDTFDFPAQFAYSWKYMWINFISHLIAFIDDYMLSFAFAGRYLYLIFLQISAPFAIVATIHKETRGIFINWIKQMGGVYMLIPGFYIANSLVDTLVNNWAKHGDYGFWMLIISLALKIFLYKKVYDYASKMFG